MSDDEDFENQQLSTGAKIGRFLTDVVRSIQLPIFSSSTSKHSSVSLNASVYGDFAVGKSSLLLAAEHLLPPAKGSVQSKDPKRTEVSITEKFSRVYLIEISSEQNLANLDYFTNGTDVCILCFSLIDRFTMLSLTNKWIPAIRANTNVPFIVVGTKMDERNKMVKALPPSPASPPSSAPSSSSSSASSSSDGPLSVASTDPIFNINNLPLEVLLRIFSKLDAAETGKVAGVCKRWNKIAKHPFLWPPHKRGTPIKKEHIKKFAKDIGAVAFVEVNLKDKKEAAKGLKAVLSASRKAKAQYQSQLQSQPH